MALPKLPPVSGGPALKVATNPIQVDLAQMSVEDRLDLRARIDESLPTRALKEVNLEQELVLQLQVSKKLQRDVLEDDEVPANQRAQVANSVASILQQLVKLQTDVYTTERLKKLEEFIRDFLRKQPREVQLEYFEILEQVIARL